MVGGRRPRAFVKGALTISIIGVVTCAVASCRQLAGIDDKTVADSCGAIPERSAQCGECMAIDCCSDLSACAADPACSRAQHCLAQCEATDDKCRSACAETARAGYDDLLARVVACRTNACAAACSKACGGGAPASHECESCSESKCCAEERACNASVACLTRRWRREQCRDASCREQSDTRNPNGAAEDAQLQACRDTSCRTQCAAWACVGSTKTDRSPGPINVTIVALESFSFHLRGVPGLKVRACNSDDFECSTPVREQNTADAGGYATFEAIPIPPDRDSFDGYFEITDPTGKRITTLVFVEPPARGTQTVLVPSFTYAARRSIEEALGVSPDPRTAVIGVRPVDCADGEGAAVKIALDGEHPEVTSFYLDRKKPIVGGAPESMTDGVLAFGGFVAVPPGSKTVRGRWAANDAELFSAGIYVRSGKFSYVSFTARP